MIAHLVHRHLKNAGVVLILIVFAIGLTSCSKKISFMDNSDVPGAEGTVKIKNKGGNYLIDVSTLNLAPSEKLSPSKKMYVVWVETKNDGVKNIGSMNSSSGFLSKALKGSLSATLVFKPRRVFITAEDEATPSSASRRVVLTTRSFRVR